MDTQTEKRMDQIRTEAMQKHFKPITSVYMDLRLLKDLHLGWLLANCTESEIAYIVERIDVYNEDVIHKHQFTYAFPKLANKEAYLQASFHDHLEQAFDYAPDTNIFINFGDIISEWYLQNNNTRFKEFISVTINTYPLPITDLVKRYADVLSMAFNNMIRVSFISQDPMTLAGSIWDKFSCIYVADIDKLSSSSDTPWMEYATNGNWIDKAIYGPPVISKETCEAHQEEDTSWIKPCLRNTELALRLCCQFQFIDPFIPTQDYDK